LSFNSDPQCGLKQKFAVAANFCFNAKKRYSPLVEITSPITDRSQDMVLTHGKEML
jgi:hypothetical protein